MLEHAARGEGGLDFLFIYLATQFRRCGSPGAAGVQQELHSGHEFIQTLLRSTTQFPVMFFISALRPSPNSGEHAIVHLGQVVQNRLLSLGQKTRQHCMAFGFGKSLQRPGVVAF